MDDFHLLFIVARLYMDYPPKAVPVTPRIFCARGTISSRPELCIMHDGDNLGVRLSGASPTKKDLGGIEIQWEDHSPKGLLSGTAVLDTRQQPFSLHLHSHHGWPMVLCVTTVGKVSPEVADIDDYPDCHAPVRLTANPIAHDEIFLCIEGDVLLTSDAATDVSRVGMLLRHVENGEAQVAFGAGRVHHVVVFERGNGYLLRSIVARAADVCAIQDAALKV
jgi:hypothetical protein